MPHCTLQSTCPINHVLSFIRLLLQDKRILVWHCALYYFFAKTPHFYSLGCRIVLSAKEGILAYIQTIYICVCIYNVHARTRVRVRKALSDKV